VHVLDFLQLDRVYFCGLSMGGMIGMFLGANAANRFRKIVLCNTAAKIGTPETWNARIDAVQKGGMRAVAAGIVERWLTPAYRASHPAETAAVLRMLEEASPKVTLRAAPQSAIWTSGRICKMSKSPHSSLPEPTTPRYFRPMANSWQNTFPAPATSK